MRRDGWVRALAVVAVMTGWSPKALALTIGPSVVELRAPAGQMPGATTMVYPLWYSEEERRRRGPAAAATSGRTRGWAELRRPSSLLVARVRLFEYATLLAPPGARPSAQRGRGD